MNREPLIRVTKRDGMPLYKNILIRACSICDGNASGCVFCASDSKNLRRRDPFLYVGRRIWKFDLYERYRVLCSKTSVHRSCVGTGV